MARLRESGLRFEIGEKQLLSNALDGLKFVISGTFSEHSRDQLKELIESHGGRNQSGVSANPDYLLAGDRIGPAKLNKARKLGVRIIGEEDFVRMLSGDMPDAAVAPGDKENPPGPEPPEESVDKMAASDQNNVKQGTLF